MRFSRVKGRLWDQEKADFVTEDELCELVVSLQEKVDELTEEAEKGDHLLEEEANKAEVLQKEVDQLEEQIDKLAAAIEAAAEKIDALNEEIDNLKNDLLEADTEKELYERQIAELEGLVE